MNSKTATMGRLPEPPVRPPTYELRRPFKRLAVFDRQQLTRTLTTGFTTLSAAFRYPDGEVRERSIRIRTDALTCAERWSDCFFQMSEDEAAMLAERELRAHAADAKYDPNSIAFCVAEESALRWFLGEGEQEGEHTDG